MVLGSSSCLRYSLSPSKYSERRGITVNFSTADPGETEPAPFTGDLMDPQRQSCKILLNGHDRFTARAATYFRLNLGDKSNEEKSLLVLDIVQCDTFKLREHPKVSETICSLETGAKTSGNTTSQVKFRKCNNGQSAAKPLNPSGQEEGSTTRCLWVP